MLVVGSLSERYRRKIDHTTEYEANAFAAHLIIDDDDIYSMSKEKYDVVQMAKMLNVNINLVLIKLQELNKLGDDFRVF